jgi:hypothetical protein
VSLVALTYVPELPTGLRAVLAGVRATFFPEGVALPPRSQPRTMHPTVEAEGLSLGRETHARVPSCCATEQPCLAAPPQHHTPQRTPVYQRNLATLPESLMAEPAPWRRGRRRTPEEFGGAKPDFSV